MSKKQKILALLGVAIVVTLGVATNVGAKDQFKAPRQAALDAQQKATDRAIEAIKQGKGRALGPGADQWMMVVRNCKVVLVKEHRTPKEVDSPGSPGGKMVVHVTDSSKEDFEAQLGPQNPACLDWQPTQEQLDAGRAEMNARNAESQRLPSDWKPPAEITSGPMG